MKTNWLRVPCIVGTLIGAVPFTTPTAQAVLTTNSWTLTISDKWEKGSDWSLGTPSSARSANLITNGVLGITHFKTISIDATTVLSNSLNGCLTISNLVVTGSGLDFNDLDVSNTGATQFHILNSVTLSSGGLLTANGSSLLLGALNDDGTMSVNSGTLNTTSGAIIGNTALGQLSMTNTTWLGFILSVGVGSGSQGIVTLANGTNSFSSTVTIGAATHSQGTLTVAGGTNNFASGLTIGDSSATGTVWITGGKVITTTGEDIIGNGGVGAVTMSNGNWFAHEEDLGEVGISAGTLTVAGGTNSISFLLSDGVDFSSAGAVWVTGGELDVSGGDINGVIQIGKAGVGQLTVSNGTLFVLTTEPVILGYGVASQGTFTIAGGNVTLRAPLEVALTKASGSVWLTGGTLVTSNNADIGSTGIGQMAVSNGTWQASSLAVGAGSSAQGTLTIAGGTNILRSSLTIAENAGSTGAVWLTGGLLSISNGFIDVGNAGVGQMTVSNGTWNSRNVTVPFNAGGQGTLIIAGGSSSLTNLVIGSTNCATIGILSVSGGALAVTNSAGTGVLEIRSGTFTFSGGTVVVDKFVLTNSCAHFVRTGGTLIYGSAVLNPNDDSDGDGIPNGYEQAHGLDPLNPADASADNDGDGLSNLQEYLAGTDPNSSASVFRITSISQTGNNVLVMWMMGPGKTNALQVTSGSGGGAYATNSFANLFIVTNTVGTMTNYLDVGAATNKPSRYYRVRLVP